MYREAWKNLNSMRLGRFHDRTRSIWKRSLLYSSSTCPFSTHPSHSSFCPRSLYPSTSSSRFFSTASVKPKGVEKNSGKESDVLTFLERFMEDPLYGTETKDEKVVNVSSGGYITEVGSGVVMISGLQTAHIGAIIHLTSTTSRGVGSDTVPDTFDAHGVVLALSRNRVMAAVWPDPNSPNVKQNKDKFKIQAGDQAWHLGEIPSFPSSSRIWGKALNPLGQLLPYPFDESEESTEEENEKEKEDEPDLQPVLHVQTPTLLERISTSGKTIHTGISLLDVFYPLTQGSTMVFMGPKGVGKTTLATDIVRNLEFVNNKVNQSEEKVHVIYVVVGKSQLHLEKILADLKESGASEYTTVIAALDSDPLALQYLAPYSGSALSDWIRNQGGHSIVIYDDLGAFATSYYRLTRAAPLPMNSVAHVIQSLLNRHATLKSEAGGGSSMGLVLLETENEEREIALPGPGQSYVEAIQGGVDQIVNLNPDLAIERKWPALGVDKVIGKPPSRYSSPLFQPLIKKLNKAFSISERTAKQYQWASHAEVDEFEEDEEEFVSFNEKFQVLLSQAKENYFPIHEQYIILFNAIQTLLHGIKIKDIGIYQRDLLDFIQASNSQLWDSLSQLTPTSTLTSDQQQKLKELCQTFHSVYTDDES